LINQSSMERSMEDHITHLLPHADPQTDLPVFLFDASALTDSSAATLIAAHCSRYDRTNFEIHGCEPMQGPITLF
jgi:hypothetical protein